MQYIDQPKSGRQAILSPELAVISGRIRTDSVDDLRRFERAFPFDPRQVIDLAQDVLAREGVTDAVSPARAQRLLTAREKSDIVFKELLPRIYAPRATPGWSSDLYFNIEGAGDYTLSVRPDGIRVSEGKVGQPDASVEMDAETFAAVMRFEALDDSGIIGEANIVEDESKSEDLSDEQLELVAGGKGKSACGAAACTGNSGSAVCGAAYGDNATCGTATYAVAGCTGAACGADACVAAACVGAACGGAACAGAASAMVACAGAACGAAASTSSGCGAAACGAAACAGDYCGAAVCPAAACAGNVCGVDAAPGPDVGPCAVNVIPCLPFI